jgi:succinate dehydrogenase / fumarate reductase cytochrome b subunit
MLASTLHRITGMMLWAATLGLSVWVAAAAAGPAYYNPISFLLQHIVGQLALAVLTGAVIFHWASGLRYLFWDAGRGFNPRLASHISIALFALSMLGAGLLWGAHFWRS